MKTTEEEMDAIYDELAAFSRTIPPVLAKLDYLWGQRVARRATVGFLGHSLEVAADMMLKLLSLHQREVDERRSEEVLRVSDQLVLAGLLERP